MHTQSVVTFSSPLWSQVFSSLGVHGRGAEAPIAISYLLAIDRHVLISAFGQLEASKLARGRKPLNVLLNEGFRSACYLLILTGSNDLLVYTQTPYIEGIIIRKDGDTGGEILIVCSRALIILDSIIRLLIRSLDFGKSLLCKVNVASTISTVFGNILGRNKRKSFERPKQRSFPRDRAVDGMVSNFATCL